MNKEIIVNEEVSARGTERTLAILEFLGGFRKGKSISEIARGLNLPINSVSRITDTMTLRGWLYRKEDDRRFVLTNRVAELTRPQVNDRSLTLSSWQELKNLRDRSGETTQLVVMVDGKCTILEQCISTQAIKVSGEVGMRVPCYSCAPGKSILANLPNSEFKKYTDGVTLKKFTPEPTRPFNPFQKRCNKFVNPDLRSIRQRDWKEYIVSPRSSWMTTIIQLEQLPQLHLPFACEKNGLKKLDKPVWSPLNRSKTNSLIKLIRES